MSEEERQTLLSDNFHWPPPDIKPMKQLRLTAKWPFCDVRLWSRKWRNTWTEPMDPNRHLR
ncbi:Hypothetical protein FKW44_022589 [Caligus rogercresseyi]|uniref:Uncharacterized protein n=1 Tax=Caligus rogercresseyi TaxID=217165 RepID=A0A7T8GNE7_CALRO|nr:Hypothetical protein FKW44_022589 [Caligus rogercresseyi]